MSARIFAYSALLALAVLVIASVVDIAEEKALESKAKEAQRVSWLAETQAISARKAAREASARFLKAPDDERLRQEANDLGRAALRAEEAARDAVRVSDMASQQYEETQWHRTKVMMRCHAPTLPSPRDMPKCFRIWLSGE